MIKKTFISLSSFFHFKLIKTFVNIPMVAPFYHIVTDNPPPHVKELYSAVSVKQFINDIDFLLKHYTAVTVAELQKVLLGEMQLNKPALFISFDDGFSEVKTTVAPILKSKGVPATFFVTPSFIANNDMLYRCKLSIIMDSVRKFHGRIPIPIYLKNAWGQKPLSQNQFRKLLFNLDYNDTEIISVLAKSFNINFSDYLQKHKPYLNLEELKELAKTGFTIGAHSMNHPNFAKISSEMQKQEIESSVKWVQKNIPNQPNLFAFPFSSDGVSESVLEFFLQKNNDSVDIMFGTSGLKLSPSTKLLQRIPMELKGNKGKQIIKGEYLYYIAKAFVGKNMINLPV